MPSNCVVFRGVHKLKNQLLKISMCSRSPGMSLAVVWYQRLKQTDLLGCLRIWCVQESRLASSQFVQAEITK